MDKYIYLKRNKKKKTILILIRLHIGNGVYFKYSTGETFDTEVWNEKGHSPKFLNSKKPEHFPIKESWVRVKKHSDFMHVILSSLKLSSINITRDILKVHFDKEFKNIDISANINRTTDKLKEFIEEKETSKEFSENTIKRYKTFQNIFVEFIKRKNLKATFEIIDAKFYHNFLGYCRTVKKHQNNTIGRNISVLKNFMRWSVKKGFTNNVEFKYFKQPSNVTTEIALTYDELLLLYNYIFVKEYLTRARDLFCFGAFTGMRYSDFSRVRRSNIQDNVISMLELKNGKRLTIPLNSYSLAILKKYDYRLPVISNQKLNIYIKKAGEIVGLTEELEKTIVIGNKYETTVYKKYELIGTHTARRSFVTIAINNGMQPDVVMKITSHKKLATLYNSYVKTPDKEATNEMERIFGKPDDE